MTERPPFSRAALLWGETEHWREVNQGLSELIRLHGSRIGRVQRTALHIRALYVDLFPLMDRLCAASCPSCPEPCCAKARVWIDFADLLFLHLSKSPIPRRQLITDTSQTCTFAGPAGCSLPRLARPWICLWYLCPIQRNLLRGRPAIDRLVQRHLRRIKAGRRAMEDGFIRLVSGRSQNRFGGQGPVQQ